MLEVNFHIDEVDSVAKKVMDNLSNSVVLFYGEMGVGKTTFIKSLARMVGSRDNIQSPTYSIVNEYEGVDRKIYHFDLYRIKNKMEALDLGFEDYFENNDNLVLIEWPEKVIDLLPEMVDIIAISVNEDASRSLKLSQNINLTKQKLMMQQHFS